MITLFHINDTYNEHFDFPQHQHTCGELEYVYEGVIETSTPHSRVIIHKNQFTWMPANTPHKTIALEEPVRTIFLISSQNCKHIPAFTPFDDFPNGIVGDLFRTILREYKEQPFRDTTLFFKYLDVLDAYFHALCRCDDSSLSGEFSLVSRMHNIINENISNCSFSLKKAFLPLGYSTDYLRRIFKEKTGYTPKEYLLNQRIGYACRLMQVDRDENRQVKDVALLCGFRDPLYFSRFFREKIGLTPSEFIHEPRDVVFDDCSLFSTVEISPEIAPVFSQRYEK